MNDKSCQAKRLKVEQYEEYSKPEEEKVEIKDKTEDNSQESNSSSSAESSQNLEDSKTSGYCWLLFDIFMHYKELVSNGGFKA